MERLPNDLKKIDFANQIAEKVARKIMNIAQVPKEFEPGGVPVAVAARVYGKSALYIKTGIKEGWLPIGHITESDKRSNVYISPKKLYEDTGYIWKGKKK